MFGLSMVIRDSLAHLSKMRPFFLNRKISWVSKTNHQSQFKENLGLRLELYTLYITQRTLNSWIISAWARGPTSDHCCGKHGAAKDRAGAKKFVHSRRRRSTRAHFNLFGLDGNKEVLMTKDHIIPRAKGGKNHLSNYQTMCLPCNLEKADS